VRFSIVTPSLNQLKWLQLAVRSVADQSVSVEHLIQDGGTGLELEHWVRTHTRADLSVESDSGMYDALNHGFARARGEIWAWLNCDEQYLPGALSEVEKKFEADPKLDVLLADNIVVGECGEYVAHRLSLVPTRSQLWVRFPVASCALFFRARVWEPFDTQWKSAADWWWFRRLLERGAQIKVLRKLVSAFAETRCNLGLAPVTLEEQAAILTTRPWWARLFKPGLIALHRWRLWRRGAFSVSPFRYAIHTHQSSHRVEFDVKRPTARWVR
jgi:glycosyltransferase involved in cell wall biosynthesis